MNIFEHFFNKEIEKYPGLIYLIHIFNPTFHQKKIVMIGKNMLNINTSY